MCDDPACEVVGGVFWRPDETGRPFRTFSAGDPTRPPATSSDAAGTPAPPGVPDRVAEATILIWFSSDCSACTLSKPIFDALENNRVGLRVLRVEATPAVIKHYQRHITIHAPCPRGGGAGWRSCVGRATECATTLPMYDFVFPMAATALGA
jgi:hypothetical protein